MFKSGKKYFPDQKDFDLVVIGSGPAGIHAAMQAAKMNKRVAVVEKNYSRVGGAWIHTGTIPSKTLRESLATIHSIKHHAGGKWVDRVISDLQTGRLFARARKVSLQEEALVRKFIDRNLITVLEGAGTIKGPHEVSIDTLDGTLLTVTGESILVGTGSRPRRPDDVPFDNWRVLDSDQILNIESIPKTMLIYGAGVIGCEYACIFQALGVEVTIVDARDVPLAYLDREVGGELQASMEDLGVKFVLNAPYKSAKVHGPEVEVIVGEHTFEAEVFFFAAGRVPNTEELDLKTQGIEVNGRGNIIVDDHYRTNIKSIYAAGDVIGAPSLAATSLQQGRYIACHAFGVEMSKAAPLFPIGVYTIPELSAVGLTEEECKAQKIPYIVGRSHYREIARGYIRGDAHGLVKLLVHADTHRILGIHIVGNDAANLIHTGMAFMMKDGHVQDFIDLTFNYPTLAEGYRIAAFNALNKIYPDGIILPPPELELSND